jgi:hypothetical protein
MTTTLGRVRAPDLCGAGGWLNTDHPLAIRGLRGRVVVLDFWTFCCINCIRVIGVAGARLALTADVDLAGSDLDLQQGPPVHVNVSADPQTLLGAGPRSWALDGLPVSVEVRLGGRGRGVLTLDVIASTCEGDVCTIRRNTREHSLTVLSQALRPGAPAEIAPRPGVPRAAGAEGARPPWQEDRRRHPP